MDRYTYLKKLQNDRLRETYRDFAQEGRFRPAAEYFFGQVYNTDDTAERDAAFVQFYKSIRKFLGGDIVRCMREMIELQNLTIELDQRLVAELKKLAAEVACDMETYERAYRLSDNYDQRIRQIQLIADCLRTAHRVFRRFGIGAGLKALHKYQQMRGDTLVTEFLVQGYEALHRLRDIEPLVRAIEERELARLDRIYAQV